MSMDRHEEKVEKGERLKEGGYETVTQDEGGKCAGPLK